MALYPWKGSLWLGVCTCTGHAMGAGSKADTEMLADVSRGESNEEYVELVDKNCYDFYTALAKEGKLKLRTYAGSLGMTKNVAYMWHEEDRLGSLETGKIANMTVYDRDFLKDDIEKVGASNLVCTIVDGDIVYKV